MKNVLKSLWDFMPGRERPPEDVEQQPVLAMAAPEAPPARPPRQMVDPSDIEAAAEPVAVPDILNEDDAPSAAEPNDPVLEAAVLEAVKTVRDPEIPVDLVSLGLIYELVVGISGKVYVEMTLTTPNCPSAADLPRQVEDAVRSVEGVTDVRVKLVFSPPWNQGLMTEEARLELGLF
jgi:FeS assembly SUF system protein